MVFDEVTFPDDFSGFEVESKDVSFFAERVDGVVVDGGCAAGATFVIAWVELAVVGVFPEDAACVGVEAPDGVFVVGITHGEYFVAFD